MKSKKDLIVSVIVPAYNAAGTMQRLLDAMTSQTVSKSNFELIVIDDGSTDSTMRILDEFAGNDVQILILQQANAGPGQARNYGIENAKGRIIAFTDADCVPDTDWLKIIINEIEIKRRNVIGGEVYCRDDVLYPWKISPAGQFGITANLAIRREVLAGYRFDNTFNGLLGEDTDLVLKLEALSKDNAVVRTQNMRVEHPINILNMSAVIKRARARMNEVALVKRYGSRVYSSMNIFYKPLFLGSISPLSIFTLFSMIGAVLLAYSGRVLALVVLVMVCIIFFVAYGYKFLLTKNTHKNVGVTDRIRTLIYFTAYNFIYLCSRVEGSVKYRKIVV